MTDQQKMIAGAVLAIALIAAAIYYLFYKGKSGKSAFGAQGASKNTSGKVGGGASSAAQQAPQVVYTTPSAGSVNANVVASWLAYSPTMQAIQKNLNETCFSSSMQVTADGVLGNQTLNAIKSWANAVNSAYGKQIAAEIESTKYVTRAQADWLLKPCTSSSSSTSVGAPMTASSSTGITLSNYRTVADKQINAFVSSILSTKAGTWTDSQIYEWLYAYLKGAQYFYCNNCWNKGYYSTANLSAVRFADIPSGSKYVNDEGGNIIVK